MGTTIGDMVGAKRWPYAAAHPDCWGRPRAGELLAGNDPRARCEARGLDMGRMVPVLWDFGDHGRKVQWEYAEDVRPYAVDVAAWEAARTAEFARLKPALRLYVA